LFDDLGGTRAHFHADRAIGQQGGGDDQRDADFAVLIGIGVDGLVAGIDLVADFLGDGVLPNQRRNRWWWW
jgi:hypothetical protein